MTSHYPIGLLLLLVTGQTVAQVNSTIGHNGITRNHITYVPSSYSPDVNVPLVFVLHGFTQSNSAIMNVTGFNAVAEANGFIAVYPNGVNNGWNTSGPFPGGSTADDVGYITALADTIIAQFSIDTTRIYSTGFSAGGYMSHKLACESPRCFAAIASVAGTINTPDANACAPSFTPGVLQVHGTSDIVVSYNGSFFSGLGVQAVLNLWTGSLNCDTPPMITTINSTVERRVYAPCDGQAQVVHDRISGGGHVWPTGSAYQASTTVWDFLQEFTCGQLSTGTTDTEPSELRAWPNPAQRTLWVEGLSAMANYEVLDLAGRTIVQGTLGTDRNTVDLERVASGLHTLRLLDGTGRSIRFIKQ